MPNNEIELAKFRSLLSNERTLLSYTRTSASMAVLSIAMLKFFENRYVGYGAWIVLAIGVFIIVLGVYRYAQQRKRLRNQEPLD